MREVFPVYTFRDNQRVTIFLGFDSRAAELVAQEREPGTNGRYLAPSRTVQVAA